MNEFIAHILVVDDDDGIRLLVKEYLNENKFLVTTANSAENATEKVSIIKFDLIVLDVMMTGKSGLDFIKENKKKIKILEKKKNIIKFSYDFDKDKFIGTLIYTGLNTGTGGRIKKAYKKLNLNEDIMMTYGDGLSSVSIKKLIKFHYNNKAEVTMTAVRPKQRFGVLKLNKNKVKFFDNSNKKTDVYINGGFFVISKNAIKQIKDIKTYWEIEPLKYYLKREKLYAFKHEGFWKSLDTLKDKNDFNQMFIQNKKPWIV